jgi:hypothetical protein
MIYSLTDYQRGEMQFNIGRTGLMTQLVLRRVLIRRSLDGQSGDGKVFVLPRRRRIGKLGPAKVLEFRS